MSFSLTTQLQRIASLHASGLNSAQISSIVGVSPSRISQLVATSEYQDILTSLRSEVEEKNIEETAISAKYLSAEHALLSKILENSSNCEMRDLVSALRVIAERQERAATRKAPIHAASITHNQVIQLVLPSHALPELTISSDNQITSIANQSIAPLTAEGVTSLFSSLSKGAQNVPTRTIIEAESLPPNLTSASPQINRITSTGERNCYAS